MAKKATPKSAQLEKEVRQDWSGGINAYVGSRQIADNESPDMVNCDFVGKGGLCNRLGYTQIGTPLTYTSGTMGMGELHTSARHQALNFISNGAAVVLSYSTDGGVWTNVTGTTFVNKNIDGCQAAGSYYVGNGTDAMVAWDGAAWNAVTNQTLGTFPRYYNQRIWVIDEAYPERLNFSGQYSEQLLTGGQLVNKLGDFSDATSGWISFKYGSGAEIVGIQPFKDSLYVFLRDSIYKINPVGPSGAANTFTIAQVTSAVGCVSGRSIAQVGEDLFFAADDGIYSLGDIAYYTNVRATNKSIKIQKVFDNMSATNKGKLVGAYKGFKYHLFYSLGGLTNDACVAYDTRYKAWVDWRNMPCSAAMIYINSTNDQYLYIGNPINSAVMCLYTGATDNGTGISSYFKTKSFDEGSPDTQKVYFDHTFIFSALNGSVTMKVIFDDLTVAATKSLSTVSPQGGFGTDVFGLKAFGEATNTKTVVTYSGNPERLTASDKKFAVQYQISSSDSWILNTITTTYKPLSHYAFPSTNKIT